MSLFNQRFKELKAEKNIMLKDLASDLGYSSSKLSYYLNGNNEPSYDELIKISNYFGVSIEYMLGVSPYRTKEQEYLAQKENWDTIESNDSVRSLLADMQYLLHKLYIYQDDYHQTHAFSRMVLLCKALKEYLKFCECVSCKSSDSYSEIIDYGYEILTMLERFYNHFVSSINSELNHIFDDPNTPQSIKCRMSRECSFSITPSRDTNNNLSPILIAFQMSE